MPVTNFKNNVMFKVIIIAALIIILQFPTALVRSLIHEREEIHQEAVMEVSEKWGTGQTITGPYISIPYDKIIKSKKSYSDSTETVDIRKEWLYIMPEDLKINGQLNTEERYRGLHDVVVYESDIKLEGIFKQLDLSELDININNVHFDKAQLNVGISDLKGIEKQIRLKWNDSLKYFNSGLTTNDIVNTGISVPIDVKITDSTDYRFALNLDLKGSQDVFFTPLGKTTDVKLSSQWKHPSFAGEYLPDSRNITENGFQAHWNILHLNRNYPQMWRNDKYKVGESIFGTNLLLAVDRYKKSDRVAKYSILFISLTFIVFFFVEILNKSYIHPIQYLLVGTALIVFYTLLLSFSEHMNFDISYLLAAVLTLLLISTYTLAIIKSKQVSLLMFGILTILYGFIYTIISMQDFSLIIGSIGLFLILALVMYFSRKIDWYEIKLGGKLNQDIE